ncbi:hypothetical protein ACWX0K_14785 [Nitrobacteraceae bacterium UC4446_H13]
MSDTPNFVEAIGESGVLITPYYVNNALAVMRDFEAQSMSDDKSGKTSKVAQLTFDEVVLAASLASDGRAFAQFSGLPLLLHWCLGRRWLRRPWSSGVSLRILDARSG